MQPKRWCLLLIMVLALAKLQAQGSLGEVIKHKLASKATGQQYELFVSLPPSYSPKDTVTYPVLYVLDGNFMFPVMDAYQHLLSEIGEVREVIIVGIGYPTTSIQGSTKFRTPDYTPTKDTAFESMLLQEMKMKVETGGADRFVQALKEELFPFIEQKYKTGKRGLAGHSFGALFGAYVLLQEPALFDKYLLSSISMFWDREVLLKKEQAFFLAGQRSLNAQVFVTVGEQEGFMDMIPSMRKFAAALRGRNYGGLILEERVLPNETHASAFLTAFNQGLRVLYKK
jgi:predicted alpha/beta superfamily hydrolase